MVRVTLRPTVAPDLPHVLGEPLPCRIRTITALVDNRIVGLGGLAFPPHGIPIAFVQLVPKFDGKDANAYEATRYPIAFHRAGLIAMKMIQESGLERVIATADVKNSTALRWLNRLGFTASTDQEIKGKVLFIWNRKRPHPLPRN
jgi:hypothetical protein